MIGNDMIANWLLKANSVGVITKKTAGEEAKKIGYLSEHIDLEDEIELAGEESMKAFEAVQSQFDGGDPQDSVDGGPNG